MIREKINKDFIIAMKSKDSITKDSLGMLKSKITEADKRNGKEIDDITVLSVIQSYVKQIEQSITPIKDNPSHTETLDKLEKEKHLIMSYLPKQLSNNELSTILNNLKNETDQNTLKNINAFKGIVMKYFKLNYNGQYNAAELNKLIEQTI